MGGWPHYGGLLGDPSSSHKEDLTGYFLEVTPFYQQSYKEETIPMHSLSQCAHGTYVARVLLHFGGPVVMVSPEVWGKGPDFTEHSALTKPQSWACCLIEPTLYCPALLPAEAKERIPSAQGQVSKWQSWDWNPSSVSRFFHFAMPCHLHWAQWERFHLLSSLLSSVKVVLFAVGHFICDSETRRCQEAFRKNSLQYISNPKPRKSVWDHWKNTWIHDPLIYPLEWNFQCGKTDKIKHVLSANPGTC